MSNVILNNKARLFYWEMSVFVSNIHGFSVEFDYVTEFRSEKQIFVEKILRFGFWKKKN